MGKKIIFKHLEMTHQLFVGMLPVKPFFMADTRTLKNEFKIPFIKKNKITTIVILHDSPAQKNLIENVQRIYSDENIKTIAVDLFPLYMGSHDELNRIFKDLASHLAHDNIMLFSFDNEDNVKFFLTLFLVYLGKKVNSARSLASAVFKSKKNLEHHREAIEHYSNRRNMVRSGVKKTEKERGALSSSGRIKTWILDKSKKGTADSKENVLQQSVRLSLRTKLIASISGIVIISMLGMILLATYFFKEDNISRILENNLNFAELIGEKIQSDMEVIVKSGTSIMMTNLPGQKNLTKNDYFSRNSHYIATGFIRKQGKGLFPEHCRFNDSYKKNMKIDSAFCGRIIANRKKSFSRVFTGETIVLNISPQVKRPVAAVLIPVGRNRGIFIFVALEHLYRNFKIKGVLESLLVNNLGEVLVHPDSSQVQMGMVVLNDPVVREMLTSTIDSKQIRYRNNEGKRYLASFSRVGIGGLGVIVRVLEDKALAAVYRIQERNIYILIIVITLAVLFLFFFARSLTRPIINLARATEQIKKGDYHIDLKPAAMDEIGLLTESFVAMGQGLEEREKIKDAFGKFVNREIAEEVLKGDLSLGGKRVRAVIMFCDIRSFTSMSERLEPELVVDILNTYLTEMVRCINDGNGIVDKFIGDALMALWGVPVSQDNDAQKAVETALHMREALRKMNAAVKEEGHPVLHNGCGISAGDVVAGKIGSADRMEYTVIGKSVNIASRIEALNKPFGTDILITADVYEQLRDDFIMEKMQQVKVKGKEETLDVYTVLGRKDDPDAPGSLAELQYRIGIKPEETGANENGIAEVKYRIIT